MIVVGDAQHTAPRQAALERSREEGRVDTGACVRAVDSGVAGRVGAHTCCSCVVDLSSVGRSVRPSIGESAPEEDFSSGAAMPKRAC